MVCIKERDLCGVVFGRLTVLKKGTSKRDKSGRSVSTLTCECVCGVIKDINTSNIKRGSVRSCGCLARELASERLSGKIQPNTMEEGEASFNILYSRYREGASKRNKSFTLSKREFEILTKADCYYCGIPPNQTIKGKRTNGEYLYNGIDREDNDHGYEYWNCVACCKTCNFAKSKSSQEEFYDWIERLIKYHKKVIDKESEE